MDGFDKILPRSRIPAPLCREMQSLCLANATASDNEIPKAERKFDEASDSLRDWVEADGKVEQDKRRAEKRYCNDQIYRHGADKRHWLIQAQAWRTCLLAHPELSGEVAGSKCSHGYVTPMCAIDKPVMKVREREPGDDDDEDAA